MIAPVFFVSFTAIGTHVNMSYEALQQTCELRYHNVSHPIVMKVFDMRAKSDMRSARMHGRPFIH